MQVVKKRNEGIDLLRGLSIVFVVMHHVAIRIPLTRTAATAILPDWFLSGLCWNGAESVMVFFVISGFLITGNALQRWPSLGMPQFRSFYTRRTARILPCLLALVVVLALLDLWGIPDYVITRSDQTLAGAIFAALSFHVNWYEAYSGYLPGNWDVLWSLSVEEVFYFGFPLACLLARRGIAPLAVLLSLFALSLPVVHGAIHGNELLQEKAYLPGMAAIATGVVAAIGASRSSLSQTQCVALVAAGCLAWIAVIFAEDLIWPRLGESTMLILTVGIALLLVGLHGLPSLTVPFSAWLRAFGRLSYEIYLTHMFVVFSALRLFHSAGLVQRSGWWLYPAVLAASLFLGRAVSLLISAPAERRIKDMFLPRASSIQERSAVG